MKIFALFISLIFTVMLTTETLASFTYRVKRGDTLSKIAKRFHVSMRTLARVNHIKKPYRIRVGQKLIIPSKKKTVRHKSKKYGNLTRKVPVYKYYRVRRGDSVYKIAKKFHVSMKSIIRVNHLRKPYTLRPGRKLKILVGYKDRLALGRPLEFKIPLDGRIDTTLRQAGYPGIFILSPPGQAVKAAETGIVKFAGKDDKLLKAFGNTVILEHPKGYTTVYSSLSRINVKPGQLVKRGEPIGESGTSGNWGKSGIYFEISRIYNRKVYQLNPVEILR